jgi:hypothetical protein
MTRLLAGIDSLSARLLLATAASLACGCTAAPDKEHDDLDPPPYAIGLQLRTNGDQIYGIPEEWRETLLSAFESTAVASAVFTSEERKPDFTVDVQVGRSDDPLYPEARINMQGALLDFLAWSTVPFLPLWILDVEVRPELEIKVGLVYPEAAQRSRFEPPIGPPTVKTCHLDRHSFWSWPTAGALLLPPFVFRKPAPERLQETIALEVRRAVASEIAAAIERRLQGANDELLYDLSIERHDQGLVLRYRPDPNCKRFDFHAEPVEATGKSTRIRRGMSIPNTMDLSNPPPLILTEVLQAVPPGPFLLRIDASGRDGRTLKYTVPFNTLSPTPGKPAQLAAGR